MNQQDHLKSFLKQHIAEQFELPFHIQTEPERWRLLKKTSKIVPDSRIRRWKMRFPPVNNPVNSRRILGNDK